MDLGCPSRQRTDKRQGSINDEFPQCGQAAARINLDTFGDGLPDLLAVGRLNRVSGGGDAYAAALLRHYGARLRRPADYQQPQQDFKR